MSNTLTVKHLRKLIDLAYAEVERLRKEKAEAEGVAYVAGVKPVNIFEITDALNALEKLNDERVYIETWFRAAEHPVNHVYFDKLLKALQNFGVAFHVNYGGTGEHDAVTITTRDQGHARTR